MTNNSATFLNSLTLMASRLSTVFFHFRSSSYGFMKSVKYSCRKKLLLCFTFWSTWTGFISDETNVGDLPQPGIQTTEASWSWNVHSMGIRSSVPRCSQNLSVAWQEEPFLEKGLLKSVYWPLCAQKRNGLAIILSEELVKESISVFKISKKDLEEWANSIALPLPMVSMARKVKMVQRKETVLKSGPSSSPPEKGALPQFWVKCMRGLSHVLSIPYGPTGHNDLINMPRTFVPSSSLPSSLPSNLPLFLPPSVPSCLYFW